MLPSDSHAEAPWPWFYPQWATRFAESFYFMPQHLQQSILPWSFAGLVINEMNSRSPSTERAVVSRYSYGQQLGRISDALQEILQNGLNEKGAAIESFLEMKESIDHIKDRNEDTRFEAVLSDLRRLRSKDTQRFKECLDRVAALGVLEQPLGNGV